MRYTPHCSNGLEHFGTQLVNGNVELQFIMNGTILELMVGSFIYRLTTQGIILLFNLVSV